MLKEEMRGRVQKERGKDRKRKEDGRKYRRNKEENEKLGTKRKKKKGIRTKSQINGENIEKRLERLE